VIAGVGRWLGFIVDHLDGQPLILAGVEADVDVGAQGARNLCSKELPDRSTCRPPDELSGDAPDGYRVVHVVLARRPKGVLACERPRQDAIVECLLKRQVLAESREAGTVSQDVTDANPVLSVRAKLGPDLNHRRVERWQAAALNKHGDQDGGDPLGAGGNPVQGVRPVRNVASRRRRTGPEIHDRRSVHPHGERGPGPAVAADRLLEGVGHALEAGAGKEGARRV
jgi:hypothetical protein